MICYMKEFLQKLGVYSYRISNPDFSMFADDMYEFRCYVRQLENYNEKMNNI